MEHLDVLIVGAGLSGIGAACHLERQCSWASYAVLEARDAIGGTWDLFRFPGMRSDSDMFTLGYSFRPWDGDKTIADGASILQYIRDTAAEYGVDERIRFHHRIVAVDWSTPEARWHVTVERTDTGERVELTCGFLFTCCGYYRYDRGHLPEFAGLDRFGGTVVHPQGWPEGIDYAGERVVVIGSGATAVTLIPAIAGDAAHVTMLQRSPSYIAAVPDKSPLAGLLRKVLPGRAGGLAARWALALLTQGFYQLCRRRPEQVKRALRRLLIRQLPDGYDVDTHFTPRYDPWDQRFCVAPNGDLFKAIRKGKVSVVTDHIDTFTATGVRLRSGAQLDADLVIAATGLELLFLGGIEVRVDGEAVELPSRLTYKGTMLEGVPNLAFAVGYTNASWTLKCDLTCGYVCRLLNYLRETGQRQCTPVNGDREVTAEPLLGLMSGYIKRSAHKFPRQGSRSPWRVHQSFLSDYRALKLSGIHDEAMTFSNPAVTARAGTAAD